MRLDDSKTADPSFVVRFMGVRGSFPVPSSEVLHFGGNTSCVEVVSGPFRVVLDCGTGIIPLGAELAAKSAHAPVRALVLLSHVHHDHTMGWPFFKPVYDPRSLLWVHGPSRDGLEFKDIFEKAFSDPYFPVAPAQMSSRRVFRSLRHGDVLAWADPEQPPQPHDPDAPPPEGALVVRCFRNLHHPNGGVLNYRLERGGLSVVMATDIEGSGCEDGDLAEHAAGADLLIHDAQYTEDEYPRITKGWGHSTWSMAVDLAERAKVRRLVLYHHDPAHDDAEVEAIERLARERFPRTISACEGLEIRI